MADVKKAVTDAKKAIENVEAANPFIKKLDLSSIRLASKASTSGPREVRGTLKAARNRAKKWAWFICHEPDNPNSPQIEINTHIQGIPPTDTFDGMAIKAVIDESTNGTTIRHTTVRVLPPYPRGVVSQKPSLQLTEWMDLWQQTLDHKADVVRQAMTEKQAWDSMRDVREGELRTLDATLQKMRGDSEELNVGIRGLQVEKSNAAKECERLQRDRLALEGKMSALESEIDLLNRKRTEIADRVCRWVDAGWISEEEAATIDQPSAKSGDRFAPHTAAAAAAYVDEVHRHLVHSCHLLYPRTLVENIFALLATHDTLLFAGSPGSGKTAFVRAFSEATSSLKATIIPVKPNWTSGEDLFGYWNPAAGHFVASEFTAAILKAANNPGKFSLICLDEMNLARVEYYFADLLSALENRSAPEIQLIPDSVVRGIIDEEQRAQCMPYQRLKIPPNVRIIGCLNMDETTLALSPKVLDRVHVVQFPDPLELPADFTEKTPTSDGLPLPLDAESFKRCEYPPPRNDDSVWQQLTKWRDQLTNIGMTLSPRTIRQAMNYRDCLANIVGEPSATWQALNNTCLQKFVPRLERDMPDQVTADARHASVMELFLSFEKLTETFPEFAQHGKAESVAAAALRELYQDADKRPDKRYSVWK